MEALISYLLKSGSLLLFFSLVYYLLLRNETFFRVNRFYLLGSLLLSIMLPWITFTKIVWEAPASAPIADFVQPIVMSTSAVIPNQPEPMNWPLILGLSYAAGALYFIGQFFVDYYLLRKVLAGKSMRKEDGFRIIETSENISPFSFFNYIVYNPEHYTHAEKGNILEHEKTHCREYHSLDVLFTRLCCVAFWFNPVMWLTKSQIIQNLEFIADAEAGKRISDRRNYQITLLKVTARENHLAFTNPFYQSLIKKRIVMLNKKQSKKSNLWKYTVVIPVLIIFMLQFQVDLVAQTKQPKTIASDPKLSKIEVHIDPASTEKDLNEMIAFFKDEFGATLQFSDYKTNALKQVIGLKVSIRNKDGITKKYEVSGKTPIDPFTVYVDVAPDGKEDFGFSTISKVNKIESTVIDSWRDVDSILSSHTDRKDAQTSVGALSDNNLRGTADKTRMLYIINGKDYYPEMIKDQVITTSEYIEQLSPEEGSKRYGKKGSNGVLIFHGVSTFDKKGKEELNKVSAPATITLENGNEVVFFSNSKMKVPGFASVDFTDRALELIINGVKYFDPKETIEGMDLSRIKSIQIVEPANPDDKQKAHIKVLIQLK